MGAKTFPWMFATVPWADGPQWTRGVHDGLPLLSYGCAPRNKLATYRQLRAMGLRPNGSDPVAVLYGRHNRSGKTWFASLYLIANAAPVPFGVTLVPDAPVTFDVIVAAPEGEDPDGDTLAWTYTWWVDGRAVKQGSDDTWAGVRGDRVSVTASASDGERSSVEVASDPVTVGNAAPVVANDPYFAAWGSATGVVRMHELGVWSNAPELGTIVSEETQAALLGQKTVAAAMQSMKPRLEASMAKRS